MGPPGLLARCVHINRVSEGLLRPSVSLATVRGRRNKATKAAVPLANEIDRFAQYHPTTLSLQNFIDFGVYYSSKLVEQNKDPRNVFGLVQEFAAP